ncbi:hypothetical protein BCR43DRAFT_486502 [Syncephalastrum racemosum]|uniref:CsbD-like domain-containing protein n=1 Tax=Syncephalastrum racemosum TaxID=13706 RepID=A0A1X2HP65_SYNRA|nr:hypothetical protein BCR43DRAFT_486502 [Syncephalastrum racemosum]
MNNNSNTPSKTEGKIDQNIGNVKEGLGNVTGQEKMQSEGTAQRGQGEANETAANVTDFVKNIPNKAEGAVKGVMNSFTGGSSGNN